MAHSVIYACKCVNGSWCRFLVDLIMQPKLPTWDPAHPVPTLLLSKLVKSEANLRYYWMRGVQY